MKKGLKIFLIALETIFIALVILGAVTLILGVIELHSVEYGENESPLGYYLEIAIGRVFCVVFSMQILSSVLMILSLHGYVRNSLSAKPAFSVLRKVCLATAAAANLVFYLAFYFLFFTVNGVGVVPFQISAALWLLCVTACIASLIAIGVKNAKAKRVLPTDTLPAEGV